MKKNLVFIVLTLGVLAILLTGAGRDQAVPVYFTSRLTAQGVLDVYEKIALEQPGKVAVKVHFGEEGNQTYLDPGLVRELVLSLNATLIETNVLYVSKRRYTESHIQLARDHGFDYAPIDIIDSDGETVIPADLNHYNEVRVGRNLDNYDNIIIFSHFKGHGMSGFGGAIKNVSMGLASIPGKMALHASAIPVYDPDRCISCGLCVGNCPGSAIKIDPLVIEPEKCIGCGSCIGICPVQAFGVPWGSTQKSVFLERLADYTKAITDNYDMIYINVLANITRYCDCAGWADKPFMDDIGILASHDIVALEKASHDLVDEYFGSEDTFKEVNSVSGKNQIDYAAGIGLGSTDYQIIDIDQD